MKSGVYSSLVTFAGLANNVSQLVFSAVSNTRGTWVTHFGVGSNGASPYTASANAVFRNPANQTQIFSEGGHAGPTQPVLPFFVPPGVGLEAWTLQAQNLTVGYSQL